jgi:hypothetical protein
MSQANLLESDSPSDNLEIQFHKIAPPATNLLLSRQFNSFSNVQSLVGRPAPDEALISAMRLNDRHFTILFY